MDEERTNRIERESTWDKINLFLKGHQWLRPWSKGNNSWKRINAESSGKLYFTVNKMVGYHRAALARLMMTFPGVSVLPASHSQEDILKAITSAQILRHYWFDSDLDTEGFDGARHLVNYGSYALHTFYAPEGSEDPRNPTGLGKVRTETVSPYNWFLEPGATSLKESEYIILRTYVTQADLIADYPKDKARVKKLVPKDKDTNEREGQKVREIKRFEKLEWYFKDGSHGVSVGREWFEKDKGYFNKKFFPVQIVYYTKIDDTPYGLGVLEPLLQLQWAYNKSRTRVMRNLEKMGHAKLMVPNGCKVRAGDWNDTAGGMVSYNAAAGKPWPWAPSVNIGQEVDHSMRISAEMDDSAGIHSVSRGKQVPGMRSGKAIEALGAADTTDLLPTIKMVEAAYRLTFGVVLHLMKRYYKKDRMLRMWDSFGSAVFKTINDTKIVDEPDIFIEVGSMFRDGQEKRRSEILELFQLQLITPEEATEAMGLHVGLNNKLMRKIQGLRKALDVLGHVKEGKGPVRFFATDDFKSIKLVIEEYMGSEEFATKPEDIQNYLGNIMAMIATQQMDPQQLERLNSIQVGQQQAGAPPTGQPGQAVQTAMGQAQSPAAMEANEEVAARRNNTSPMTGKAL